jgi:tetratricopeptide (TPR) repeat protein
VLHEVKALALFSLGRFRESAAVLNALLAVAPGMDWTSMSNLFDDVDEYTRQLRVLEEHIRQNPDDASAMFVLAYHYLVIGQNDAAVKMLKEVVRLKPDDVTAKRMLETLDPPDEEPAATEEQPAEDGPTTDLVGNWASNDKAPIKLTIDEQSQFTWQASPPGKPAVKLSGDLIASSDTIALETENEGTMIGRVRSGGPDKFTLLLQGMPADDPGIVFTRQK